MASYPLKVENLPNDITRSDVREFFDSPSPNILENIEIFSNGLTSTAVLVLARPDVAYEFLNLKDRYMQGNRVIVVPEYCGETSITLNGSWLREIEDENPAIQIEIQKIADKFNLKLALRKSEHGNTISLNGVPWRMEQARASLNYKIQSIIMNRSANVQKRSNETSLHPDAAGIQSPENKESGPSTKVDDMHPINTQPKSAWRSEDPQLFIDAKSGVETKESAELDNPHPGKRRVRTLITDGTKSETSGGVASMPNTDAEKEQPREVKRTRVLKSKPDELQTSESSVDALGKSTPVSYPSSTQYQAVIRVDSDIHRYLVEHSTALDFTDSSFSQIRVSEQHIDWVIGNNNEKDLRMNEEQLKRLIDKLRIESYSVPNEFEFDIFKDLIETSNKNDDVTLIFNAKERGCKVVGLPDEVKTTLKWLIQASKEFLERNIQKPGQGPTTNINDDSRPNDKGSNAHKLDRQHSGSQFYSSDNKSDISDIGNKQSRYPDPKQQMTKAGDGIRISKSSKDKLKFTTRGNLKVLVYQGNMIKQPTEVIVNPANESLAHGGGLARVILDAGGPVIDDESRKIISKQGKLRTGEVAHTSAGRLPSPIKYVIHAVGPTAYEFKDNKAGLVPTLKITFRNCLEYANDKLGVSSISLPPISSGIFAVPMPDIIQGACEAIQDFDQKNPSPVLKEVHFISNDAKTTEEMILCFQSVIG